MNEYEFDSEVPYWRSDVDVATLLAKHTKPGAIDVMTEVGMIDPDDTKDFDLFALMTGRFLPLISNGKTYCFSFSPGMGDEQAITFPVMEDGQTVDLLAISTDDSSLWGCVTGRGGRVGSFQPGKPVRVYYRPWRWLLFGCDGVVVLRKDAYSPDLFYSGPDDTIHYAFPKPKRLADASCIYAETVGHAEELLHRLFVHPALAQSHPSLSGQLLQIADRAENLGASMIGVDSDREDLDGAVLDHSIEAALREMKSEGMFG